jgi:metal transporter CNNM
MLGALKLDGRRVGCNICIVGDPEKAADGVASMITAWSTVTTIDIDQVIDQNFMTKLKNPYSRIPVVSREGKVFGYLHVKVTRPCLNCVIGSDTILQSLVSTKLGTHVRDLPLCSIPIVQADLTVYEVLDMFQREHSRIAIVIPNPFQSVRNHR